MVKHYKIVCILVRYLYIKKLMFIQFYKHKNSSKKLQNENLM